MDQQFIVAPGRSVLTARRGMAHGGGKVTRADFSEEGFEKLLASGKIAAPAADDSLTAAPAADDSLTAAPADDSLTKSLMEAFEAEKSGKNLSFLVKKTGRKQALRVKNTVNEVAEYIASLTDTAGIYVEIRENK